MGERRWVSFYTPDCVYFTVYLGPQSQFGCREDQRIVTKFISMDGNGWMALNIRPQGVEKRRQMENGRLDWIMVV